MNRRHRSPDNGFMAGRRHMGETLRIPQPVTTIIFGMQLVKVAVMAHSAFDNDDLRDIDFVGVGRVCLDRGTIPYWTAVVRGWNNTA